MVLVVLVGVVIYILSIAAAATAATIFWLHHSVGRNLISEGNIREQLDGICLYDQDYNYIGLTGCDGQPTGHSIDIPNDDTDPAGLHQLLTTPSAARDSCLQYDVAAFKSCYTASEITSDDQLDQYKALYSDIATTLQALESQTRSYVMMSPPPRHRLATTPGASARAREFANWMGTLAGGRIFFYDLFDQLADEDGYLKYEYEQWHGYGDSHPNQLANTIVGADVATFLITVVDTDTGISGATPATETWGSIKAVYSQ